MPNEILVHPEQPRFLFTTWLWAVVLFVFFGAIVAIAFGAMHRGSTYEDERAKTRAEKLKAAREETTKMLNTYGWVDKSKGIAHIPIQRAMELALLDLKGKKPVAAGPIATPEPAAAAVTATGAAQPSPAANVAAPPTAPTPVAQSVTGPKSEIRGQPTGAANPPNAVPQTQPGAAATPAAAPQSHAEVPAVSPTVTPIQSPVGTPLPTRGKP